MNLKEISFKVWRPAGQVVPAFKGASTWRPEGLSTVDFKLGLGPCGRFVESLESAIDYHGVTITQVSYPEDIDPMRKEWMKACLNGADSELIDRIEASISAIQEDTETKVFFYKLEDVRGRIVAISL